MINIPAQIIPIPTSPILYPVKNPFKNDSLAVEIELLCNVSIGFTMANTTIANKVISKAGVK